MSTWTLLLRLAAPLQSWGTESKFDIRKTGREPSKSGVIGLVAAALGIRRNEDDRLAQLAQMRFGLRVEREGRLLRDYQTARKPKDPYNESKDIAVAYVTERYYLADACFIAGLESDDEALLRQIEEALHQPAFPLFLGRRSCPPVGRLFLGIEALPLEEALALPKPSEEQCSIRYVWEVKPGEHGELLRDQPVSFNPQHRKYTFRQAKEKIVSCKRSDTEHDPLAELE